jgi:hypothetical protein
MLSGRLAGKALQGQPSPQPQAVVWVDRGDEVVVHLESVRTQIRAGILLVSVDLETDQTGRTPVVVVFAIGDAADPAGLIGVTDEFPRGNGALVSRWGKILQEAIWACLLGIVQDYAHQRSSAPTGISASTGVLQLHTGIAPVISGPKRTTS